MNRFIIFTILSAMLLFGVTTVYAQSVDNTIIPVWVKGVINFWADGSINDDEFVAALEFLIEQNIINIDNSDYDEMEENAKYWEDMYDDAENRRVAQSQNADAQHKILYDEKDVRYDELKVSSDERYNSMMTRLTDGYTGTIAEKDTIIAERDATIEDLNNQLRER